MKFIVGVVLLTVVFFLARASQKRAEQEEKDMLHDARVAARKAEEDGTS